MFKVRKPLSIHHKVFTSLYVLYQTLYFTFQYCCADIEKFIFMFEYSLTKVLVYVFVINTSPRSEALTSTSLKLVARWGIHLNLTSIIGSLWVQNSMWHHPEKQYHVMQIWHTRIFYPLLLLFCGCLHIYSHISEKCCTCPTCENIHTFHVLSLYVHIAVSSVQVSVISFF